MRNCAVQHDRPNPYLCQIVLGDFSCYLSTLEIPVAVKSRSCRVFVFLQHGKRLWQQLHTCKHLVLLSMVFQPKAALLITKEVFFRDGNRIGISRACIAGEKKRSRVKANDFLRSGISRSRILGSPHVSMPLVDSLSLR